MSKIHLLDSPEPIQAGGTLKANCGAEIPRATLAFVWDEQVMGAGVELDGLRVCRKCRDLEFDHRYIYGLVAGEQTNG